MATTLADYGYQSLQASVPGDDLEAELLGMQQSGVAAVASKEGVDYRTADNEQTSALVKKVLERTRFSRYLKIAGDVSHVVTMAIFVQFGMRIPRCCGYRDPQNYYLSLSGFAVACILLMHDVGISCCTCATLAMIRIGRGNMWVWHYRVNFLYEFIFSVLLVTQYEYGLYSDIGLYSTFVGWFFTLVGLWYYERGVKKRGDSHRADAAAGVGFDRGLDSWHRVCNLFLPSERRWIFIIQLFLLLQVIYCGLLVLQRLRR
jgi:hypothetical protein